DGWRWASENPTCPTTPTSAGGVVDVLRRPRPGPGYRAPTAPRRAAFSRCVGVFPAGNSVLMRVGLTGPELGEAPAHDVRSRDPRGVPPAIRGVEVCIADVDGDQECDDRGDR